ncbi:MAG: adenylate/guanylate cyclase domain-containing protein [Desulfobacteraceae bacterium]|nr:adenylate/guanylate cyclase domain-containing protein [Desulfobacteraceae bacterium]
MPDSSQKWLTILFADIANSTRLYEQLGDEQARSLIALCMDLLIAQTKTKKGAVIKTIGDEVLSTFSFPDQAAAAAILMHEKVSADETLASQHLQLRIGIHHGPVIEEDSDIYGDAVNIAARMVGQAKAGQTITNALTLEFMGHRYKSTARLVDQTRVKGKIHPIDLYELSWGHPEDMTMITTVTGRIVDGAGEDATLLLDTQERQFIVNQEHPVITMGRDAVNTIKIVDPKVSRLHARIELRKDKFVLIDQSTNGTFLIDEQGIEVLLRRDEITLPEKGTIGLGEKALSGSPLCVQFKKL